MPTKRYSFESEGPKRLEISWPRAPSFSVPTNVTIRLDGKAIGVLATEEDVLADKEFSLPDGSILTIQYSPSMEMKQGPARSLIARRNGELLPEAKRDVLAAQSQSAWLERMIEFERSTTGRFLTIIVLLLFEYALWQLAAETGVLRWGLMLVIAIAIIRTASGGGRTREYGSDTSAPQQAKEIPVQAQETVKRTPVDNITPQEHIEREQQANNWLATVRNQLEKGSGKPVIASLKVTATYGHVFGTLVEMFNRWKIGGTIQPYRVEVANKEQGYILAVSTQVPIKPFKIHLYIEQTDFPERTMLVGLSRDSATGEFAKKKGLYLIVAMIKETLGARLFTQQ